MFTNQSLSSTASYFVNWSYQNSKACTVLVGESTEMFPASKATTLETSNKSLTSRPHQSAPSSGSGTVHSRSRRSVDGHASEPSVPISSTSDSSSVDMHELTPTVITVSLVHGVQTEGVTSIEGGNEAFVSSSVDKVHIGVTNNKLETSSRINEPVEITTAQTAEETITIPSVITKTTEQSVTVSTLITTESTPTVATTEDVKENTNNLVTYKAENYEVTESNHLPETVSTDKYTEKAKENTNNIVTQKHNTHKVTDVDKPLEIITTEKNKERKVESKDNIAYDPKAMQGDAFPSIYSYGVQKLQYLKLLTRLNEVSEEIHIYSNESAETESNMEKFHYDSERTTAKQVDTTIPPILTTVPITELPVTVRPTESVIMTTHTNVAPTEHVVWTSPPLSDTNSNIVNTTEKNVDPVDATVNIAAESKTSDTPSNAKHVMINLTISSDDAENSIYKPLYSLTVKVPTFGDTNEIPTVKITPIEVEPTQPSNFNRPVTVEGTTKGNKATTTEPNWGGSCECSCPVCEGGNSPDDFYDEDYGSTTGNPKDRDSTKDSQKTNSTEVTSSTEFDSTTETVTETTDLYEMSTESDFTTDVTELTTDLTTETETEGLPTTEVPKCICPKVLPPPILILEGEVIEF